MKAMSFFSKAVPCKKRVVPTIDDLFMEDDNFSIVDGSYFRVSKNGVIAISGKNIDKVGYLDCEMFKKIDRSSFSLRGVPVSIVNKLKELEIIEPKKETTSYCKIPTFDFRSPYYARMEITDACQCTCSFCYKDEEASIQPSLEELKKRIWYLKKLGIVRIELLGGEPFLNKNLLELCAFIKKEGLLYTITTNGEFIKDCTPEELTILKSASEITVSLDSYGEYHDKGRGRNGLFDAVVSGLNILKSNGISCTLLATINEENVLGLDKLIHFLEPYQIPLSIRPMTIAGEAKNNKLKNIQMDEISQKYSANKYVYHEALYLGNEIEEAYYYGCDIRHLPARL